VRRVSPERFLYDKQPNVMLTYWEIDSRGNTTTPAKERMKLHAKRIRKGNRRGQSSSGEVVGSTEGRGSGSGTEQHDGAE